MTIKEAFATVHRKTMQSSTKADQKYGEALLVNWVGKSLRPFVIIEDEGFVQYTEWLNHLRTKFKLPSRQKLREQLVQVSHLVEKKIVEEIKKRGILLYDNRHLVVTCYGKLYGRDVTLCYRGL